MFISYSWTSEPHKEWVRGLAERLSSDGVEVVLDRWDLKPGHDINVFMEQMVTDPTMSKVLVVCDKAYAEKADKRKGGVGTETHIISAEVYQKVRQEKFIPIIRERDEQGTPYRPTYLKSTLYFDFTDEGAFEEIYDGLLRNLHNAPELVKPPVGKPPAHIFNQAAVVVKTAGKFNRLRDALEKDRPHKDITFRDYLESLSDALEEFRITEKSVDKTETDDLIVQRIGQMDPYRDQFIEFCVLYATYADTEASYIEVHSFFERLLRFHQRSETMSMWSKWYSEPHQFVGYEWVLYLLSTLIHNRRFATATRFMDDKYQYRHAPSGEVSNANISEFCYHMQVLEEHRPQRLDQNTAVVAAMIQERATHPRITFDSLVQTDTILLLRPFILNPNGSVAWHSRLADRSRTSGPLDVFARANTPKGQAAIWGIFGAKDAKDLARKMAQAFSNESLGRYFNSERFRFGYSLQHALNWEELKRLLA